MEQEGGDTTTYPHGRGTIAPKEDKATRPKGGNKATAPEETSFGCCIWCGIWGGLDDVPNAL